jgi:WD40 repeat protein
LVYVPAEKSIALLTRENGIVIVNSSGDVIAKMPHPTGKQIERIAAHPILPILAIVLQLEPGVLEEGWIVDAKTLKTTKTLEQEISGQIGFSPDGSELISWQQNGIARIRVSDWTVSRTPLKADGGRSFGGLTSIFVGGPALGVFGGDGAGRIYHFQPGTGEVATFEQIHNYDISSLAHVGRRLISTDSGPDSRIVVWDVDRGKKLIVRPAIRDGYPVLFAKRVGSSRFVAGYGDGLLQLWTLK